MGGLCLSSVKHAGILTYFQTIVNKKTDIKAPFLVILSVAEWAQDRSGEAYLVVNGECRVGQFRGSSLVTQCSILD